jgi:hypothetical protein
MGPLPPFRHRTHSVFVARQVLCAPKHRLYQPMLSMPLCHGVHAHAWVAVCGASQPSGCEAAGVSIGPLTASAGHPTPVLGWHAEKEMGEGERGSYIIRVRAGWNIHAAW